MKQQGASPVDPEATLARLSAVAKVASLQAKLEEQAAETKRLQKCINVRCCMCLGVVLI
jgi:hypothetical protein